MTDVLIYCTGCDTNHTPNGRATPGAPCNFCGEPLTKWERVE